MNLLNGEKLTLGTCYYPEHWPETMWEEDLRRMLENGIEVIRIAEFAWNKVEPTEGTFTFDFFDRFLDVAEKMGMSRWHIAWRHMASHLLPQFLTGLILLFPHAILHEASVTFLGFGLSAEQPAIGVILSESMSYLTTGRWWLALFPGAALVLVVVLFSALGEKVRRLTDPASVHA